MAVITKRRCYRLQDQIIISVIFNLRDGFFDSTSLTMNVDFNPQLRLQIFKTLLKRKRFHMFITS